MKTPLLLLLLTPCLIAQVKNDNETLEKARGIYVGHQVFINVSTLGCWHHVGKVAALNLVSNMPGSTSVNALGDPVEAKSDPDISVSVRCPNGTDGVTKLLLSVIPMALSVLPDGTTDESIISDLQKMLASKVGTTIYPKTSGKFYTVDSTISDLESENSAKRDIYVSPLSPLNVTAVKVWSDDQGIFALLKVRWTAAATDMFISYRYTPNVKTEEIISQDFTRNPPNCWVAGMPIVPVYIGEAEDTVMCKRGYPQKLNTYGDVEQWVYNLPDGTTDFVYIRDGKVSDLQHLDK